MKKKGLSVLLALAMTVSLAACGSGQTAESANGSGNEAQSEAAAAQENAADAAEAPAGDGTIHVTVGVNADFGGLDPYGTASNVKATWTPAVYQTLFTLTEYGGEPVSILVDHMERVDETTFDITIYDYIYDSQGNNITAEDVAYSYQYAKDCGTVTKMYYVDSVEVTGDYSVRLKTSSDSLGVWEYALTNVYIVSKAAHEASGDSFATSACGTGPYELGGYVPSSTLELIRKENYWQTEESLTPAICRAVADRVVFNVLTESTQMGIAMENGSIDMIAGITGSEVDRFVEEDGVTVKAGYSVTGELNSLIDCLFLNMDEGSVFADNPKLREAVLYGFDAEAMVTAALEGKGEACKTFGSYVYADCLEKWENEDYYGYDLERAQAALKESGFVQKTPFRILYQNAGQYKAEAELIQAYLQMLGLECELLGYDNSLFNDYKYNSAEWDMKIDPCKSPDILPNLWGYCLNSDNYENGTTNFIHDDTLQKMTVAIATEEGHTDEKIDEYHQYLIENNWLRAMIDPYNYNIAKDTVTKIVLNAKGYVVPWACEFADNYVGTEK